jgi:hypothetical protein
MGPCNVHAARDGLGSPPRPRLPSNTSFSPSPEMPQGETHSWGSCSPPDQPKNSAVPNTYRPSNSFLSFNLHTKLKMIQTNQVLNGFTVSKNINFHTCALGVAFSQELKVQSSRTAILSAPNASSRCDWTGISNISDLDRFALLFNGAADTPF